jgi:hypothetical protein
MKFKIFLCSLLFGISSYAQINLIKIDSSSLPQGIKHMGHVINAVKWLDNQGVNYVITTESGKVYSKVKGEEDLIDAFIYAYHYIVYNDSCKLVWRIYDYNKGCGLDLDLYFLNSAFAVTDLDKNGIPEIWVMYKNSCHGDVSPVPTKIIMYEGKTKYALRGESRVEISSATYIGGLYTLDDTFKNGPFQFKQHAEKLWTDNKLEKWSR